jgi:hypothetical protein
LVNRMCYGLRLDRGCERRLSAFARRGKSGEICAFWQIEMKRGRAGLECGFFDRRWRISNSRFEISDKGL